jgi:hypothetical protein
MVKHLTEFAQSRTTPTGGRELPCLTYAFKMFRGK